MTIARRGACVMMLPMIRRVAVAVFALATVCAARPVTAAKSLQEAIGKVERETQGKVLSAETKHNGRSTVYRIKVLTREGQVRVIEVPANDERPSR
jgi:uncharacterized membrane protein YkoI